MKSLIRTIYTSAIISLLFVLTGCGDSVSQIKGGTLGNYPQTTIGNAFDAAFVEAKWEGKETANKTKFVEFTGKTKGVIGVSEMNILTIPQGAKVRVQFTINQDDSFSLTYAESPIQIGKAEGDMFGFASMAVSMAARAKGLKLDGTTPVDFSKLNADGQNTIMRMFVDAVYNSNWTVKAPPTAAEAAELEQQKKKVEEARQIEERKIKFIQEYSELSGEWVHVADSNTFARYHRSWIGASGNFKVLWSMTVYNDIKDTKEVGKYKAVIYKTEYDCDNKKTRQVGRQYNLGIFDESPNMKTQAPAESDLKWEDIDLSDPKTIAYLDYSSVCLKDENKVN